MMESGVFKHILTSFNDQATGDKNEFKSIQTFYRECSMDVKQRPSKIPIPICRHKKAKNGTNP